MPIGVKDSLPTCVLRYGFRVMTSIREFRRADFETVESIHQAGIFPENQASIALHERRGFRVLGIRERLGQLHGVWRDVAFKERRSALTDV